MPNINKSVYTTYFTDAEGNITGIKQNEEQNKISPINFSVQLQYIPEEFNRVVAINKETGDSFHEINDITLLEQGCFYVDYNTGRVTFSSEDSEKVALFSYYGLGYELLSCRRLYDQTALETDNIIRTLQDIIDAGRAGIEYLNTIGDAVTIIANLKEQITLGNNSNNTLKTTISTANSSKTNLDNSISTGDTLKTNLETSIGEAREAKSDLDSSVVIGNSSLSDLETTISTANSSKTDLDKSISTGNTLKTNLDKNIVDGTALSTEIQDLITTNGITTLRSQVTNLLKNSVVVGSISEFETALANRSSLGYSGSILFKSGTYKLTKSYSLPAYTYLGALGDGEVIIDYSSTSINNAFRNELDGTEEGYDGSGYITIENLTFDGKGSTHLQTAVAFAHSKHCHVQKCTFKNHNYGHMIEINSSRDMYVQECVFENYGVQDISHASEMIQIDFAYNYDVYPWDCNYDSTPCLRLFITHNQFKNCRMSCIGNHSFSQVYSQYIYIISNIFEDCFQCIALGDVHNLFVFTNKTERTAFFVALQGGSNTDLWNWQICNNDYSGTRGQTGYTDFDTEGRFIRLEAISSTGHCVNDLIVTGNHVSNANKHGISLTANYVTCNNNVVQNSGGVGIFVFGGSHITITGNVCTNNGLYNGSYRNFGIALGANTSKNTTQLVCTGNMCQTMGIMFGVNSSIIAYNFAAISEQNSPSYQGKETNYS